ncbi:Lrp/AsnC family transcriptional regulator [Enemella evansiae]|uniref:Lrp/AsnC family transcriptional regulator n=1 Tax=Enemella evansiae TaxID=2016499 RepID=UPI000B968321|nr:AsnC family transcriptional regulator [Enemella evansiae]OYO14177.1 AsnC family transcriptional regulator [Enemella evansiae]TDO91930.1 DNA-binding Lrp family transcriptional regulator [Enemella evansiae]
MRGNQVDATDLEIVDALQHNPRASWAAVARALGLAEVTVARRWRLLEQQRLVWVSAALHPEVSLGAFLEVSCEPRAVERIAAALAEHPDMITVGRTTGDFQIFAILLAGDLASLLQRIGTGLPELGEAVRVRQSLFRRLHGGVHWRQGIIPAAAAEQLTPRLPELVSSPPPISAEDRALFRTLNTDGRLTAAEVAERIGSSRPAITRRLTQLEGSRQLLFRCDVARPLFDLPLGMLLWLRAPDRLASEIAAALGAWTETRLCAVTIGSSNIVLIVGLHDLADAEQRLIRIAQDHPQVEVVDRRLITRMMKVYGRILDEQGRGARAVPVDPWRPDAPSAAR